MCATYPKAPPPTVFVLDGERRPDCYIDAEPAENIQAAPQPPSGGDAGTPEDACKCPVPTPGH